MVDGIEKTEKKTRCVIQNSKFQMSNAKIPDEYFMSGKMSLGNSIDC